MPVYRVYRVYDDGRLEPGEAFYCRDDGEAIPKLTPPADDGHRTELWHGGRFVAIAFHSRPREGLQPQKFALP